MDNSLIIPPVSLSLIVTDKCTAECSNCCFGCKQSNKNKLAWSEIKDYIDQATDEFNTIKLLIITGGECFTIGKGYGQCWIGFDSRNASRYLESIQRR